MAYDSTVLRRATRRLEEQRTRREERFDARRRDIFRRVPQLAQIEKAMSRTYLDIIAASLKTGDDPAPSIEAVREKNLALQAQRRDLLVQNGYPADALDDRPNCPKCGDSGWVGAKMCDCLRKLCAEEQIRDLSSLLDLGGQSFDTFSLDYYPNRPWPGEGETPRERMEFILSICCDYAKNFPHSPHSRNLFLTGAPGLGKTFLSACIARTVLERGYSVVYDTAVNVFAKFEEQKFSRIDEDLRAAREQVHRYLNCDLLILDDLGSEMTTPMVQSSLYSLINHRIINDLRTVISSNLSMDEVRRRYAGQTASRLEGEYLVLPFYGEDIRLLKRQRS